MPDILPTVVFPNFKHLAGGVQTPSEGIFIPLASLPGLSQSEANELTGDGRKVAYELVRTIQAAWEALPTNSRPGHMIAYVSPPSGLTPNVVRRTYTISFDLEISGSDVVSESVVT